MWTRICCVLVLLLTAGSVLGQQIFDIWQTTWDRKQAFTYTNLGNSPINFVAPSAIGQADIVIDDTQVFQTVYGFGASLTDSSAQLLNNLKTQNSNNYWALLGQLFNPADGANSAGFTYLRVPLGATDFSSSEYTFDDTSGDTSLSSFNIGRAPSYVFSVIKDIMSINSLLRVHLLPWSPPGWMKSGNSMNGGTLNSGDVQVFANYLLKSLQGFQSEGIPIYAIGIQNEPENSDSTYPSTNMPVATEAAVGTALRALMNNSGFSCVKIIGYEHNWDDAGGYPIQLMQQSSAFDGVSFHCYAGSVSGQQTFHTAYPSKSIYFTECTGEIGSDWWSDIKWYMDNLFIGAITNWASSGLMWNLALDGSGKPTLPGSDSCPTACRGVVTINSDGSYSVNQEFYAMGQASKAILPKDVGGPWGQRIGVSVGGTLNWALVVGAYVTARVSSSDWLRYSIVVLNWDDNSSTSWDPIPVQTTIEFRNMQATYTFPVGVTTMWWFAPNEGNSLNNSTFDGKIYAESDGKQLPLGRFH